MAIDCPISKSPISGNDPIVRIWGESQAASAPYASLDYEAAVDLMFDELNSDLHVSIEQAVEGGFAFDEQLIQRVKDFVLNMRQPIFDTASKMRLNLPIVGADFTDEALSVFLYEPGQYRTTYFFYRNGAVHCRLSFSNNIQNSYTRFLQRPT